MKWLKDLLEKAVETDGNVDVEALMTTINTEFPKHAVPKDTYNNLSKEKKQLETDLADRDKQLKDLGDTEGINKQLKEQIETMENENKANKEARDAEMKAVRLETAIKLALNGKVHDEDLAAGLIDKEKLVIGDDGKIVGLDEQLDGLKESRSFLFVPEGEEKPDVKGAKPAEGDGNATPPASVGSSFAQTANEEGQAAKNTIWD